MIHGFFCKTYANCLTIMDMYVRALVFNFKKPIKPQKLYNSKLK